MARAFLISASSALCRPRAAGAATIKETATAHNSPLAVIRPPLCLRGGKCIKGGAARGSRAEDLLAFVAPAGACGGLGDGAAAAGAQRRGARRSTLEAAEAAKRRGVRVGLVRQGAALQDLDAFGRRMAARAGRPDEVGVLRFDAFLEEVADQAAAADGEQN